MMDPIRNQKGIALVTTLMLLVLGLGVVAILFRLTARETKLAVLEQGYAAALDAAKAGADDFIVYVQNCIALQVNNGVYTSCGNPSLPNGQIPAGFGTNPFGTSRANGECLSVKLLYSTSAWGTGANQQTWTNNACGTQADSKDPTTFTNADLTLTLKNGNTPYTVNVKVIDNYVSFATGATGMYNCTNGCYYYTVISRAQAAGSSEYAEIYFVYRYDSQ